MIQSIVLCEQRNSVPNVINHSKAQYMNTWTRPQNFTFQQDISWAECT